MEHSHKKDSLEIRAVLKEIFMLKFTERPKTPGMTLKKKYLLCQIPIKMLKQHAAPNSS